MIIERLREPEMCLNITLSHKEAEILRLVSLLNITIPQKIINDNPVNLKSCNIDTQDIKDVLTYLGSIHNMKDGE